MVAVAPDAALLDAFHAAARDFPWYRTLLREQGLDPADIADATAFSQRCPILTKANTFDRFPLDQLAATTPIASLAGVLTSSGHGGRFSFGLQTRAQVASGGRAIDAALDDAFGVATHTTLAVNCLPMGVGFSSDRMTVATTSVREDMAVALIKAFGPSYDQLVVVADPLFANQLLDHAEREGLDWRRHRVHVVLGEETFGERFRAYLSSCLGLDLDRPERGYVMSSFGVGELGLHLLFETPATIAVRRTLAGGSGAGARSRRVRWRTPPGADDVRVSPVAYVSGDRRAQYSGIRTPRHLDARPGAADSAAALSDGGPGAARAGETVVRALRRHGRRVPENLPPTLIALEGRERERLPDGSHVAVYKDALYADHSLARQVTGAFRLVLSDTGCTMHVQRRGGAGRRRGPGAPAAGGNALVDSSGRSDRLALRQFPLRHGARLRAEVHGTSRPDRPFSLCACRRPPDLKVGPTPI